MSVRWGLFGGPLGYSWGIHWEVSMLRVFFCRSPRGPLGGPMGGPFEKVSFIPSMIPQLSL